MPQSPIVALPRDPCENPLLAIFPSWFSTPAEENPLLAKWLKRLVIMTNLAPQLKTKNNRISLNWTQLATLITGTSAIDVGSLAIRNRREAATFAKEYGFDLSSHTQREQIVAAHREAVAFIEEFFLSEQERALIPPEIRKPEYVLDLLVYSSNYLNKSNVIQMWACAVLKVMHGIFHIDHDLKLKNFDAIRSEVFRTLDQLIHSKGSHHLFGDGQLMLPLFFYEKKRNKDRKSVLLKLLQKPNYVASDIYDHLGIRLIFETKIECLFALKILQRSHLISVTSIKPFRTRNNLIDLGLTKKIFQKYRPLLERAKMYPARQLLRLDQEMDSAYTGKTRADNPHSSREYQSLQITARKMVRVPNPAYIQYANLLTHLGTEVQVPDHFQPEKVVEKELGFYFDYEIQLVDKGSYLRTMHGPASHRAYKQRQRDTAKKRVLNAELRRYLRRALNQDT